MAPHHDGWRTREHALFQRGFVEGLLAAGDVGTTTTRALQGLWKTHLGGGRPGERTV